MNRLNHVKTLQLKIDFFMFFLNAVSDTLNWLIIYKMIIMQRFLLTLSLVFVSEMLSAQWNPDTSVRNPVAITSNYEGGATLVNDGNGGVYDSWFSSSTGPTAIRVQRIDSSGNLLWPVNGKIIVPQNSGGYKAEKFLLPDSSGTLLIWNLDDQKICVQKFDGNGDTLFSPAKILYTTLNLEYVQDIHVVTDGQGGAFIVWRASSSVELIKEIHIDRYGNNLGNGAVTLQSLSNINLLEQLIYDGNGGAYYFFTTTASSSPMHIQHLNYSGVNTWPAPTIISPLYLQFFDYNITYDSFSGGCYFLYDCDSGTCINHVDTSGNLRWNNGYKYHKRDGLSSGYINETLKCDESGGLYILSEYYTVTDSVHYTILLKRLDQNGNLLTNSADTVVTLIDRTSQNDFENNLRIIKDNSGIMVSWDESRNGRICIYAQKYDLADMKVWRPGGVPVITANNIASTLVSQPPTDGLFPDVIKINNGYVFTWEDNRHANGNPLSSFNIYVAMIDGSIISGIDKTTSGESIKIFPNPAGNFISIEGLRGKGKIEIYNASGKQMLTTTYINRREELSVENYPPGIYFLEIAGEPNFVLKKFIKM